jgi:hypothetical protein
MVIVKTDNPQGLLTAIREAIDDNSIRTWSYTYGGFTHTSRQCGGKAWMIPDVDIWQGELRFDFRENENDPPNDYRFAYAFYHGKLITMLIDHFAISKTKIRET